MKNLNKKSLVIIFTLIASLLSVGCNHGTSKSNMLLNLDGLSDDSSSEWTSLLGISTTESRASGITSDLSGNIYTTGYTEWSLDGPPHSEGMNQFIVKYNSNGEKQWTRLLGATVSDTHAIAITSDSTGNVYTTGYTNGNLDGQTLTYNTNMFVVKYDSDGNKLWTKLRAAYGKRTYSYGITLDSSENIYTTGNVTGSLITGSDISFYDLFVSRFDND
ncbi:SBBP repeat-containing protein [Leptospira dzoumogneensis]|uniref:Beta-propeller repeat protein n=1 Tax=Leptospira dzoumogneensis TaxID=2484904 RepID=A0A4Z1ATP4_9LEPT|nr:SBBP repeat-containing protein [Leptospira dzoumogneensis]TGM99461.1 hypothetical protein EHR06_10005 [Leptospira dzoumogneensis]